jgi:hypothetical protein
LGNNFTKFQSKPIKVSHKKIFIDVAAHTSLNISISFSIEQIYYAWREYKEEIIFKPIKGPVDSFNKFS